MVSTRRSAQAHLASNDALGSPDKTKISRTTGRRTGRKAAPKLGTVRSVRKRNWEETEPDAPLLAKRPAPERPRTRQASRTAVEDEHEYDVPQDESFLNNINRAAASGTKAKRVTMAVREDDAAAEEQLLQESQEREGHVVAKEKEQYNLWSDSEPADQLDDEEPHQSHQGVQDDDYEEGDRDDDSSDDDVQEVASSAVASGSASQINNLEQITRIDVISTDIMYLEPEPPDKRASTFDLNCDGVNTMITAMGRKGWMEKKGEWADELLRIEEDASIDSEVIISADNCKTLFHEIVSLWKSCKDMPKAPLLNSQAQFLRDNSQSIQKNLEAVQSLTGQIKSDASQNTPPRGNSKQKKEAQSKQRKLLTRIHRQLIPGLVLALKEALLLGGYSRLETKPETISSKDGCFMACTLQFALRIVGFIDQLYGVVWTHLPLEKENENAMTRKRRQMRMEFANHVRVLKPRILAGMNELKRLAEAPIRQAELAERSRRLRETQKERDRIIKQKKDEQMMLFVKSTHRTRRDTPEPRDEYYDKHGWRLWEDEVLVGVIRTTKCPNLVLLTRQVPGRRLGEVTSRVAELRVWIKAKYEAAGILPPKWCC